METQTQKQTFKRISQLGMTFLDVRKLNESQYFKIEGFELDRTNKQGETNSFINATNVETGETGCIFIDGGIRGKLNQYGKQWIDLVGETVELIYRGRVESTYTDKNTGKVIDTEINNYDLYIVADN